MEKLASLKTKITLPLCVRVPVSKMFLFVIKMKTFVRLSIKCFSSAADLALFLVQTSDLFKNEIRLWVNKCCQHTSLVNFPGVLLLPVLTLVAVPVAEVLVTTRSIAACVPLQFLCGLYNSCAEQNKN